jgi:hypothetical protein
LNGRRIVVPGGNAQVSLPANGADKFSAWVVYRPTSERCADGIEIRTEYVESKWGDTGLTDL